MFYDTVIIRKLKKELAEAKKEIDELEKLIARHNKAEKREDFYYGLKPSVQLRYALEQKEKANEEAARRAQVLADVRVALEQIEKEKPKLFDDRLVDAVTDIVDVKQLSSQGKSSTFFRYASDYTDFVPVQPNYSDAPAETVSIQESVAESRRDRFVSAINGKAIFKPHTKWIRASDAIQIYDEVG